jgi:hypothetical protein
VATPPPFVLDYEAAESTNGTTTVSVTVADGDMLVVAGNTSDFGTTLGTPSGGGLTYTLQQSVSVVDYGRVYLWTAPSASAQTFTMSVTRAGATANDWGYTAHRFGANGGLGASSSTNVASGAPSLGLTTTGANSAVVVISGDWNGADGASRTWRTANVVAAETRYYRNAPLGWTFYEGYHSDAGAAGAKTVGLSAPAGQKYSIAAVEILGTVATGGLPPRSRHARPQLTARRRASLR